MNYIKKTWIDLGDELFVPFARKFKHDTTTIFVILVQFVLMEISILLLVGRLQDNVVIVYGARLSFLFSVFYYSHANKACKSYFNSTHKERYRRGGTKNFWYGFLFFLVPIICLLTVSFFLGPQ
ncbi:MAG: hypothetical protein WCP92_09725 [bacterium]